MFLDLLYIQCFFLIHFGFIECNIKFKFNSSMVLVVSRVYQNSGSPSFLFVACSQKQILHNECHPWKSLWLGFVYDLWWNWFYWPESVGSWLMLSLSRKSMFIRASDRTVFWTRWVHSALSNFIFARYILILGSHLPNGLLSPEFLITVLYAQSCQSQVCFFGYCVNM